MNNAFLWRQRDASKNSIQSYAQSFFHHNELQGKNGSQLQDMMMEQKGFNWNDAPTSTKRGIIVTKSGIDDEIPVFSEDTSFLNNLFFFNDNAPILDEENEKI